ASFTEPVEGERYQDLVAAMSRAVAQLSTHIAKVVKQKVKDSYN
ncbi:MAG: ABC-type transport auxiliary lipoprotein family protein, partial [Anaerolineales bacterium]